METSEETEMDYRMPKVRLKMRSDPSLFTVDVFARTLLLPDHW